MMAISAPLTRFGMYLLGNTAAYNSSELAGFIDLAVGLFALLFAYAQAFGKQAASVPADPPILAAAEEPPAAQTENLHE